MAFLALLPIARPLGSNRLRHVKSRYRATHFTSCFPTARVHYPRYEILYYIAILVNSIETTATNKAYSLSGVMMAPGLATPDTPYTLAVGNKLDPS